MRALLLLIRRSLAQHALSTAVTVASAALASGLVLSVFAVEAQTRAAFIRDDVGFDAVLGAKGSKLQLVLNTVYHLETSPGSIPWRLYETVRDHPYVEMAVPYAVGDNYRGFRIVGTTPEVFSKLELRRGERFRFARGGPFDPGLREGVVGATAARATGLDVGSEFHAYHGVAEGGEKHEGVYVVTGVLEPTNTPADRVIWIPIDGIFTMEGHGFRGDAETVVKAQPGREIPDEHKEVSAVLLRFRGGPVGGMHVQASLDRNPQATLAYPIAQSLEEIFDKLGWVTRVLRLVAYLVVAVAAGAILASLTNTMNERRREFAVLRALGAHRRTVFSAIVGEAAAIALLGALLGFLVYALILAAAAHVLRSQTGVVLQVFALHPVLWIAPLGMAALGAVAGLVPAFEAYRTDVASNL
jgi:putative ABC transport system permease protein